MIVHNGFTFKCEAACSEPHAWCKSEYTSKAKTERTAIDHARAVSWFIGRIRITMGGTGGRRLVLCPRCAWITGRQL